MSTDSIRYRFLVSIAAFGLALITSACVSAAVKKVAKQNPHHKVHYPPAAAAAIDGVWVSPWGDRVRIEKGRAYDVTERNKVKLFLVMWKDIRRDAPGRYRATGTGCYAYPKLDEPLTLSVVLRNQLVLRSSSLGDAVYTADNLDDKAWFLLELEEAQRQAAAPPKLSPGSPDLEILRLTTRPAVFVRPRAPFDLVVDYTVGSTPTGQETVPVLFAYKISSNGQIVFSSKPSVIDAAVGRPLSHTVHLTATDTPGEYAVEVVLTLGSATASRSKTVLIGESDRLLKRLAGVWESKISEAPKRIRIEYRKNALEITPLNQDQQWRLIYSTATVDGNGIVWKGKQISDKMNCWVEWETRLVFSDTLDELSGKAKIIDSGWCVPVGHTSDEVLVRMR